jgi:RHS repeat-associated protein
MPRRRHRSRHTRPLFRRIQPLTLASSSHFRCAIESLESRQLLATLYWDPDRNAANNVISTGAGLGGSGTWSEGGAAVWFNPSTNGYVAWSTSLGDNAVFAGPAGGMITITGTIGAAGVEFRNAGYTVTGGGFTSAFSGTTFTATASGRFDTPIAGTGGIVKAGAATLTLGAPLNTYTGDTVVSAGILDVKGTIQSHVKPSAGSVQGVMFYDPDLAAAVREALGADPNAWLTATLLAQSPPLTSLTVNGNLVGDLTGISNLSGLTSLQMIPGDYALAAPALATLAPLAGLDSLTTLSLHDVGLTDSTLATLPSLRALKSLDVRSNNLAVIPASVASHPLLTTLFVHGNPLLADNPRAGLAALKGLAIDVDVAPDRPEAAASVADLAARLYYLPLKMLEYVTNTVVFQPYAGAMKGPLATLQTKAGNDWDTNSLLAALYNAAGLSTRYVAGVVEVTPQQLMDYVGTREANAAGKILWAAGLKHDDYYNRFRHTWLEALVALPATGVQSWVPIDASWKLRDFRPGLPGVLTSVPFDPLESNYLTNAAWQKKSTAEYYEAKVAAWLAQNRPDLTIADIGYDGPIRQQAFSALPTALPYGVVSQPDTASRPATIPTAANYTVTIQLANGSTPIFGAGGVSLTLADVALSRLTIDPGPDARPTLRRDGVALATAPAAVVNPATTDLTLTISVTAPAGGTGYYRTFTRRADRFIAIGLDANQFSESLLVEKRATANAQQLNQANGVAIDPDRAIGGLLDLAIAQYFVAADADEASLAAITSAVADRSLVALGIATSASSLSAPASPEAARLQFPYLPADMGIDVPANVNGGFPIDPSTTLLDLNRNLLLGYTNSALEGLVLEELTNFESVSTMKAFQLAVAAAGGLSNLVEINAGNAKDIALLLPDVRADIRNAIAATVTGGVSGTEYAGVTFAAVVPRSEITIGGGTDASKQWKGVGYTLKCATSDPAKAGLNGKTVGFIIHGAVGNNPLVSYGGATSRIVLPPPALKPTPLAFGYDKEAGDPVNVATGGVYHEETDVEIPNLGVPLAFLRRYDSVHTASGLAGAPAWSDRGMGEGWSFAYSDRLEIDVDGANTVTWFTADGMRLVFTRTATGFANPAGLFGVLAGTSTTGFTWWDFDGNATWFKPAVSGLCSIITKSDRFGNGIKVDYVAGTNRIAMVSDLRDANRRLTFTYNADTQPHISAVTDFTGRTWTYGYANGRLVTATAPGPTTGAASPVVTYTYHSDSARRGLLASVTDPSGFVTSWEYYANRRGFRVTDAEGLRHSFTYNLFRRQSAFVNERGDVTRFAYDDQGNLLETQQPDRTTERSTWDANGLKLSTTDPYGATTAYAYDPLSGKVTRATDPLGNVTTTTYTTGTYRDVDTITRLSRPNDASDDVVTKFTYDATGFLRGRTDDVGTGGLNATTQFAALAGGRGLVQSTTSPRGVVTSFTYNAAGQVLSQTTASSPGVTVVQRFAYDTRGNRLTQADGNGSTTTFTYDALGRKTSESSADPDGAGPLTAIVSTFAYDISGNLTSTTRNDGRVTRTAFDKRQRAVRLTAADGTFTLVSYDPAGSKATETDALGRVTRFVYDARNRLVASLLPDGTTVHTRYNGGSRVVGTLDQAGATTTYAYDTLGRKVGETLPDPDGTGPLAAPSSAWGYDSRGNLQFVTAAFVGQAGVTPGDAAYSTHYEYDDLGRRTKETQPDPDGAAPLTRPVTSFTYDADGNLRTVTDPRGFITTYDYDNLGRRITETSPDPDGAGPLGPLVKRFVYDAAGNLRFEVAPGGASQVDAAFTTEHVYDALNREIRTILPDPDGSNGPLPRPTSTRAFNSSGFLAFTTDALGRTTSYAYDKIGRAISVTDPLGGIASTAFDAVGNTVISTDVLGSSTFTQFDAMNRKAAVRGPRADAVSQTPLTTFRYDAAGNLVSSTDALGRTTWRQYDALNRLVSETNPMGLFAGDPQATTLTEYDSAGRVTTTIDELGRRTDTVYDTLGRAIRTLAADAGQGRPTTHHGYDAAGNLRFTTDPRGSSAGDTGFTTFFFYDALGRKTATVDALGSDWTVTAVPDALPATVTTNVSRTDYDALGRVASTTNSLGQTIDYAYDALGRKVAEIAPAPGAGQARPVTSYDYDAVGNRTSVTTPLGFAVADTGFEQPGLATGTFQYAPDASGWNFAGGAGISADGSAFTAGNPAAPGGTQVLFLQGTASATQQVANWQAGTYVLSFLAARRGNFGGANDFRILVDGQSVGTFKPLNTSYDSFATAPFTVSAGPHTIRIEGLNTVGGDHTAFIDNLGIVSAPPGIPNAGFEQPALAAGSFQYQPSGATWSFTGSAGISANGSAFTSGNPAAPAGTQVLFLQGTGSATQQVAGWQAGTYVIAFRAARRGNMGIANDFRILVDGQSVGTFKPANTSYDSFTTARFTVAAGTRTIQFEGLDGSLNGNTSFIDDLKIQIAAPAITNGSFEQPFRAARSFQYAPANATWAFAGNAGISANGSGFTSGNPAAPAGTQVLFLQGGGSSATQPVVNWQAGTYTITFRAARRGSRGGSNDFRVLIDGQAVGTFKPANTSYDLFGTTAFTVTAGSHTIRFEGVNSAGGDNTSLVDDVRIQCLGVPIAPGFTTTSAYDALDRRTIVTDTRGFTTLTEFDAAGNTTSVTDSSGNVTRYSYDRLNRLVTETDPLNAVTRYAYDLLGNKTRATDRLGRVSTFTYDAADRLIEERWRSSALAAASHTITRFYDAASQLTGVTETDTANPAATTGWQFAYDAAGNVVKSRMAPGEIVQQPTSWSGILAAGDATIDWDGDGLAERYDLHAYTVAPGDVIDVTVRATSGGFTPALLLQRSSSPTEFVWFEAAAAGRLATSRKADTLETWYFAVTARDENATGAYEIGIVKNDNAIVPAALVEYDFEYDKAGNLVSATEDQSAVGDVYGFGPAASGLGVRTSSTVDALNRAIRYEQGVPGGAVTRRADYAYRADRSVGSLARYAGPGTNPVASSTATYDGLGRLTGITHTPAASASIAYGYAYDIASRMTAMTTPEGTSSFMLDATSQLLSASLTSEAYAYDGTGNRTSGGTQTGTGNRLLSDGTHRFAYDAEGNRTARFVDADQSNALSAGDTDVTVYGYDQRNRLIAVSHVNAWTSTQASGLAAFNATGTALPGSDLELRYTYDFADRRIRKAIDADGQGGADTESVSFAAYAGDIRTLEIARPNDKLVIDGTGKVFGFLGQVVQRNFYGNGVDEILAVDKLAWDGGTPTTTSFWTLSDHQDSVRDIVSGTGATVGQVVEHRQYDSFGKVVRRTTGPQAGAPATASVGVEFAYAGRPFESRTGLSDNRARWYEPGTGRFINEDPSGFKGGDVNLFRYVGNDPLDQVDPSGLAAKWASYAGKAAAAPIVAQTSSSLLVSTSTGKVYTPTAAAPRSASDTSQPDASLATTVSGIRGTVYTPRPILASAASKVVESTRWNATDREAKFAAAAAYQSNDGGLLPAKGISYSPTGSAGRYGTSGFSAVLTYSAKTDTYYLAFRGSEWSTQDWWTNLFQGVGFRTSQYDQAIQLAEEVKAKLGDSTLVLAGHSLGGGMAAAAAYATGLKAVVFNPASVSSAYRQGTPGNIRSHIVFGDILSVGRTISNGVPDPSLPNPNVRFAPGKIIVHPARSWTLSPFARHALDQLPD